MSAKFARPKTIAMPTRVIRPVSSIHPEAGVQPELARPNHQNCRAGFRVGLFVAALVLMQVPMHVQAVEPLERISEIHALDRETAAGGQPVTIEGTVYFHDPHWHFFFIGQGREFISVTNSEDAGPLQLGDSVRVVGVTDSGHLSNAIKLNSMEVIASADGTASTTTPQPIQIGNLKLGQFDCSWVTVDAQILAAEMGINFVRLICDQDGHRFVASYPSISSAREAFALIGTRVRMTGNLGCDIVDNEVQGILLACPRDEIEVLRYATPTISQTELNRVSDIRNSTSDAPFSLTGQITVNLHEDGFFLETDGDAILIANPESIPVRAGHRVSVLGNLQSDSQSPTASIIWYDDASPFPMPMFTEMDAFLTKRPEFQRVRLRGKLVDIGAQNGLVTLLLRSGETNFEVRVEGESLDFVNLASAKEVEVTGSCQFTPTDNSEFVLYASLPSDIRIASQKSVLRSPQVLGVIALVGTILTFVLVRSRSLTSQIRERKQDLADLTAQLHLSFGSIRDGVLIVDANQTVVHANRKTADYLGFDVPAGMTTEQFEATIARCIEQPEFLKDWKRLNASQTLTEEMSAAVITPQGTRKSLEVFTAPVNNEAGDFVVRLWTFHDVTEKQQLQESLLHSQKQEAIGRLAGGFAHDFNNLLTGIQGNLFVAQLDANKTVGDIRDCLTTASDASKRAAHLVSQILGFSRKTRLQLRLHDVNQLLNRIMHLLRPSLPSEEACELKLSGDLQKVRVDDIQLEQVLLNICLNAADAIRDGGRITIATYPHQTGVGNTALDWTVISIRDSGTGMSSEVRSQIFEPFFTTKQEKGTGLGLAMSEGIIHQHGGRIECDSEVGKGTEFRIFLPVADEDTSAPMAAKRVDMPKSLANRTILVVDDDELVRTTTSSMLTAQGATVHGAAGGPEALQSLRNFPKIDTVLLDWKMPGMNGGEVLSRIRKDFPDLTAIICSGYVFDCEDMDQISDADADAIIQKPLAPETVAELVGRTGGRIHDVA